MIILDSNVLSALMREVPDPDVITWLDRQPRTSIWTTSITVLEIGFGLQIMEAGKRRLALLESFAQLLSAMGHRVAAFDDEAAEQASHLMAVRHKKGQPGDLRDTMIAGIVLARHAVLATRNVRHFGDLATAVVNPWTARA